MTTAVAPERVAFLRERALLRAAVATALAHGFALNPERRAKAESELLWAILFRRPPRTAKQLVRVSPEFVDRHIRLGSSPRQMWNAGNDFRDI